MLELDGLMGMENVKKQIKEIVNVVTYYRKLVKMYFPHFPPYCFCGQSVLVRPQWPEYSLKFIRL